MLNTKLKIRDNIHLEDLENFGFHYSIAKRYHYQFDNISLLIVENREIIIDLNDDDYCETEIIELMNFIYDLTKHGLLERGDDK